MDHLRPDAPRPSFDLVDVVGPGSGGGYDLRVQGQVYSGAPNAALGKHEAGDRVWIGYLDPPRQPVILAGRNRSERVKELPESWFRSRVLLTGWSSYVGAPHRPFLGPSQTARLDVNDLLNEVVAGPYCDTFDMSADIGRIYGIVAYTIDGIDYLVISGVKEVLDDGEGYGAEIATNFIAALNPETGAEIWGTEFSGSSYDVFGGEQLRLQYSETLGAVCLHSPRPDDTYDVFRFFNAVTGSLLASQTIPYAVRPYAESWLLIEDKIIKCDWSGRSRYCNDGTPTAALGQGNKVICLAVDLSAGTPLTELWSTSPETWGLLDPDDPLTVIGGFIGHAGDLKGNGALPVYLPTSRVLVFPVTGRVARHNGDGDDYGKYWKRSNKGHPSVSSGDVVPVGTNIFLYSDELLAWQVGISIDDGSVQWTSALDPLTPGTDRIVDTQSFDAWDPTDSGASIWTTHFSLADAAYRAKYATCNVSKGTWPPPQVDVTALNGGYYGSPVAPDYGDTVAFDMLGVQSVWLSSGKFQYAEIWGQHYDYDANEFVADSPPTKLYPQWDYWQPGDVGQLFGSSVLRIQGSDYGAGGYAGTPSEYPTYLNTFGGARSFGFDQVADPNENIYGVCYTPVQVVTCNAGLGGDTDSFRLFYRETGQIVWPNNNGLLAGSHDAGEADITWYGIPHHFYASKLWLASWQPDGTLRWQVDLTDYYSIPSNSSLGPFPFPGMVLRVIATSKCLFVLRTRRIQSVCTGTNWATHYYGDRYCRTVLECRSLVNGSLLWETDIINNPSSNSHATDGYDQLYGCIMVGGEGSKPWVTGRVMHRPLGNSGVPPMSVTFSADYQGLSTLSKRASQYTDVPYTSAAVPASTDPGASWHNTGLFGYGRLCAALSKGDLFYPWYDVANSLGNAADNRRWYIRRQRRAT